MHVVQENQPLGIERKGVLSTGAYKRLIGNHWVARSGLTVEEASDCVHIVVVYLLFGLGNINGFIISDDSYRPRLVRLCVLIAPCLCYCDAGIAESSLDRSSVCSHGS